MAAYVEVPIGTDGETITFEVRPSDVTEAGDGIRLVSDGDGRKVGRATRALEASLAPVQDFMATVVAKLRSTEPPPREVTVDVALVFAGELGFVVSRGSAEASVTVSAKWSEPGPEPEPGEPEPGPAPAG